jgi:excisionase family DNA binding protein
LRTNDFDPLAYIENAFLDKQEEAAEEERTPEGGLHVAIPSITAYLKTKDIGNGSNGATKAPVEEEILLDRKSARFKKTVMSAPRPRRAKASMPEQTIDPQLQTIWEALPKNIDFLCSFYDDAVTANYYRGEFKESRQELIRRLLDPELTLEETSRLLGVCPATVRRYTNRGWLSHHRTTGGQRRFRLSDIVRFVEIHGRFPKE